MTGGRFSKLIDDVAKTVDGAATWTGDAFVAAGSAAVAAGNAVGQFAGDVVTEAREVGQATGGHASLVVDQTRMAALTAQQQAQFAAQASTAAIQSATGTMREVGAEAVSVAVAVGTKIVHTGVRNGPAAPHVTHRSTPSP